MRQGKGFAPKGVTLKQPKKKPKKASLTPKQKAHNQEVAKVRIEVEHQIGGIKRAQIVVHKFRNWADHCIDDVMETTCGLHNCRLTHCQKRGIDVCNPA